MKYAIIKVINGNYSIHAEGITVLTNAKTQFHGLCQTLWNAPDVISATVKIVDENLAKKMDQQLNSYGATYTSRGGQLQ